MIFFQINGVTITSPKDVTTGFIDLDKEERTINGTMVVDTIGKKTKVDVSWDILTKENMSTLCMELNRYNFATINYRDGFDGNLKTITVKPKDFTYSPGFDWVHNKVIWRNVTVSFEEK